MTDIPSSLFFNFALYLLIPFLFAVFFRKNRISPIIGYMIGGIVLGNLFDGLISKEIINNFAYFGIVFLMFTLGLEVQFSQMISLKRYIILGGFLQIAISIVAITILSLIFIAIVPLGWSGIGIAVLFSIIVEGAFLVRLKPGMLLRNIFNSILINLVSYAIIIAPAYLMK